MSGPETPADVHMPLADVEMPLADVDIPLENVDMPLANVDMPLAENGINDETPETPTMEVDNTHTEEPVSRLEVPVQEVVTEHKKEVVTEYKKEVVTEHKSNSVSKDIIEKTLGTSTVRNDATLTLNIECA